MSPRCGSHGSGQFYVWLKDGFISDIRYFLLREGSHVSSIWIFYIYILGTPFTTTPDTRTAWTRWIDLLRRYKTLLKHISLEPFRCSTIEWPLWRGARSIWMPRRDPWSTISSHSTRRETGRTRNCISSAIPPSSEVRLMSYREVTFLLSSGHDSTSCTLTWVYWALATQPEFQQQCYEVFWLFTVFWLFMYFF